MNKTLIYFLIGLSFLLSCSKTESEDPLPSGLNGKWNLVSFECCESSRIFYEKGDIIWQIDTISQNIMMSNNIEFENYSNYTFQSSGEYNIQIDYEEYKILIDYEGYRINYDFLLIGDSLRVSFTPESDGPLLIFKR